MARKLYKILKINYNTLETYGDVFVVYANKANFVNEELGMVSFSYCEGIDTEYFIYPQDMSVIRPIDNIGKSGKPWEPNMSDFRDGGLHFPEGRKIAHYHNSLVPINKKTEMTFLPDKVSYDQSTWHILREDDENDEEWEFSLVEIRTPYGCFDIESFIEVEQNGLVGIQADVTGYLELNELPGYDGDKEYAFIQAIAIVRQPQNIWLWLHFFDENHLYVASFCGVEKDIMANEFSRYYAKMVESRKKL